MLSTFSSINSIIAKPNSGPAAIPITLNTTNPNGAGNLGFWQLTNQITSKGVTADDANYGSSCAVSKHGQICAWTRATNTTNKFYSGNLNDGTMYERNITSLGYNTGCQAYNCAMSRGDGGQIIIISVKNYVGSPYAISFNGGASWTKITSLTGSTNLYPDVAITDPGDFLYCVGFNNGYGNAYSTDGVNWTSITSVITFQTYSCSLSSTSSPFFACCTSVSGNSRYTTTPFSGTTSGWTQYYQSANPSLSQATSDSGNSMILCSAGQVRYSNNALLGASATISNVTSSSGGTITYVSQSGQRASISTDGTRMAFVATSATQFDCCFSTNSGSTWTSINTQFGTTLHFTSCNFTQDGKKLVCLANEGLYMLELP